jgi:hypothetical protein
VSDPEHRRPLRRIAPPKALYYMLPMRSITAPARAVTERRPETADATAADAVPKSLADIADVIGSVDDDLPEDLSARYKHYLRLWGYGRRPSPRVRQQR